MGPSIAPRYLRGFLRAACTHVVVPACVASSAAAPGAERVDFSRDIQPLLAKRCVACHGPDTQEAGLRLDEQAGATRELDSGARAIVPGDAAASEMIARIVSDDPDVVMPPPEAKLGKLAPEQVELLKRWISAARSRRWRAGPGAAAAGSATPAPTP